MRGLCFIYSLNYGLLFNLDSKYNCHFTDQYLRFRLTTNMRYAYICKLGPQTY